MNKSISKSYRQDVEKFLTTKEGKRFYSGIDYIKRKWDNSPITKALLLAMLKDALNFGIKKAVVFAKKKPDKYEKEALLVYKKKPLEIAIDDDLSCQTGKLWFMYIMKPEETPPSDVDYAPNSECYYGEQIVPLEDPKELGRRVEEIIRNLEEKGLEENLPIPNFPPQDKGMYFFEDEVKTRINPVMPINFIPKLPYQRGYDNNSLQGTVNGVKVQIIDPHDDCYYQAMCCESKPAPQSRVIIKNYITGRSKQYFNTAALGVGNPLFFASSIKVPTSPSSPPIIRVPVSPPPFSRYPVPRLKIPGYKIIVPGAPITPIARKPTITGNRGGVTGLGKRVPSSLKSFEKNKRGYNENKNTKSSSGNHLNTVKRASNTGYKRGAWYNNQGNFNNRNPLFSDQGAVKYEIDKSNNSGLTPTSDLANIIIDPAATSVGVGTGVTIISSFKDLNKATKGYGYFFTDPAFPPAFSDSYFGSVATRFYNDNFFFYPYDSTFGDDTYINFFVLLRGNSIQVPTAFTDFYFNIIGAQNSVIPAFINGFGLGSQSLLIANNAALSIFEIRIRHENLNPTTGLLEFRIQYVLGNGAGLAPPFILNFPTGDIISGKPINVGIRLQTVNLGTPIGTALLNVEFLLGNNVYISPAIAIPLGPNNINTINKLCFGYVDYQSPVLTTLPLSGRLPIISTGGMLTALQISTKPVQRKYVWDYTRLVMP